MVRKKIIKLTPTEDNLPFRNALLTEGYQGYTFLLKGEY